MVSVPCVFVELRWPIIMKDAPSPAYIRLYIFAYA